jgi:hypothetical protein
MRSFQVMRYGRRTTPTTNELTQSIIQSTSLRRSSIFVFNNQSRQNSIQFDDNDAFNVNR